MNLTKLFETQAALDEHIMQEHPELKGQNNLDWKLLALQVELGECANEWRGFKKWSKDQDKRIFVKCKTCEGHGESFSFTLERYTPCGDCEGSGKDYSENPLLEEYVDCLHFILSIGLEKGFDTLNHNLVAVEGLKKENITTQFNYLFTKIGDFNSIRNHNNYMYIVPLFIGLGEILGFTWDEIEDAYYSKNKVNHARQESGY